MIDIDRNANQVSCNQLVLEGLSVNELSDQPLAVGCALTVRSDDERTSLVVVFNVVEKSSLDIIVSNFKCLQGTTSIAGEIGIEVRLSVVGGKYSSYTVEE